MLDRVTTLPDHLKLPGRWARTKHWIGNNLNFYRLHMLIFVFVSELDLPLFRKRRKDYAAGGEMNIKRDVS
jgi:hypothetical protein